MSQWSYQREEYRLSAGDYRVEIIDAQETVSKNSGNPMIVITVRPNGSDIKINYYLVQSEYFNRNATQFFDAFPQIEEGDFNVLGWIGCVGAARLKENENGYLEVAWFIDAKRAEKLPPWQGEVPERQTVTELADFGREINLDDGEEDNDLPF